MAFLKQAFFALLLIASAVAIWAIYVPSAAPYLERAGIYALLGIDAPQQAEQSGGRGFGGGPTRVVVAPVEIATANARVTAIGDGQAARSVTVRSEATGIIAELAVQPGTRVEQGTLLARLEDEAERIALERARLMLSNAESDLERLGQLRESGAVSVVQLREAELSFRSAELAVEEAEFDLSQRRILAPISGWVGLLEIEQGARIATGDAIATITDRSSLQIEFRVPERHIASLSVGMPFQVAALARPDERLTGEIIALDNVVERTSRTLRVQGRVPNDDDRLRAGQAFQVELSFSGETMPSVDPLAIQWSSDGSFVWVIREGKANREPVAIRQRNADSVLVEANLTEGEQVVTEGVQSLRPRAEVEVVVTPGTETSEAPAAASAEAAVANGALRQ